jgi:hypothetical protein
LLTEREVILRSNVSQTTVRDVLGDLRATGLVTLIPQRSAFVILIGRAEAEDLYEVRHRVETLVVGRFAMRATGDHVLRLRGSPRVLVLALMSFARLRLPMPHVFENHYKGGATSPMQYNDDAPPPDHAVRERFLTAFASATAITRPAP